MIIIEELRNKLNAKKTRGAWSAGVKEYALMLLDDFTDLDPVYDSIYDLYNALLNGAKDWHQYAAGGGGLVYDEAIIKTLCTPAQIKRLRYKEGGYRQPGHSQTWIDVEARALFQAWELIKDIARGCESEN